MPPRGRPRKSWALALPTGFERADARRSGSQRWRRRDERRRDRLIQSQTLDSGLARPSRDCAGQRSLSDSGMSQAHIPALARRLPQLRRESGAIPGRAIRFTTAAGSRWHRVPAAWPGSPPRSAGRRRVGSQVRALPDRGGSLAEDGDTDDRATLASRLQISANEIGPVVDSRARQSRASGPPGCRVRARPDDPPPRRRRSAGTGNRQGQGSPATWPSPARS